MKLVDVRNLKDTKREVRCPRGGFISRRILLERDGMGFSLHQTFVPAGKGPQRWQYKQHFEACYCISGKAMLTELSTGALHMIEPGVTYVANGHEAHTLEAIENTTLLCVFNPPCEGREVHLEDGSFGVGGDPGGEHD